MPGAGTGPCGTGAAGRSSVSRGVAGGSPQRVERAWISTLTWASSSGIWACCWRDWAWPCRISRRLPSPPVMRLVARALARCWLSMEAWGGGDAGLGAAQLDVGAGDVAEEGEDGVVGFGGGGGGVGVRGLDDAAGAAPEVELPGGVEACGGVAGGAAVIAGGREGPAVLGGGAGVELGGAAALGLGECGAGLGDGGLGHGRRPGWRGGRGR